LCSRPPLRGACIWSMVTRPESAELAAKEAPGTNLQQVAACFSNETGSLPTELQKTLLTRTRRSKAHAHIVLVDCRVHNTFSFCLELGGFLPRAWPFSHRPLVRSQGRSLFAWLRTRDLWL